MQNRYIDFADSPQKPAPAPVEDFDIDDNESCGYDFENERELLRKFETQVRERADTLMQLVSEFIEALVNNGQTAEDLGLKPVDVEAILDTIEEELFSTYDICIDRPVISTTSYGMELMPNMYCFEREEDSPYERE